MLAQTSRKDLGVKIDFTGPLNSAAALVHMRLGEDARIADRGEDAAGIGKLLI